MIYAAKHNTVKVKTAGACGTPVAEHPVPSLRISSEHPETLVTVFVRREKQRKRRDRHKNGCKYYY